MSFSNCGTQSVEASQYLWSDSIWKHTGREPAHVVAARLAVIPSPEQRAQEQQELLARWDTEAKAYWPNRLRELRTAAESAAAADNSGLKMAVYDVLRCIDLDPCPLDCIGYAGRGDVDVRKECYALAHELRKWYHQVADIYSNALAAADREREKDEQVQQRAQEPVARQGGLDVIQQTETATDGRQMPDADYHPETAETTALYDWLEANPGAHSARAIRDALHWSGTRARRVLTAELAVGNLFTDGQRYSLEAV